jgi:hypothetical protein
MLVVVCFLFYGIFSALFVKFNSTSNSIFSIKQLHVLLTVYFCILGPKGSVASWLQSLGLRQYESTLISNGFDDFAFMSPNILDEQDLLEIGILDAAHRETIINSCRALPQVKTIG